MRKRILVMVILSGLGIVAPHDICADDPPGVASLLPAQQAVENAARLSNPAAREAALREAIRTGLLESEPNAAREVLGYLGDRSRWLDLRPFEDIITEYGRSNNPTSRNVGWFLDSIELDRMSRDERLRLYSAAIVDGRTALRHGWPMLRQTAMALASHDGLAELKPLIEAHYGDLSAEDQHSYPLAELLIRLDLGAGAVDREDAARLAAGRLAAMKDEELRDRMNTDTTFQNVVEQIGSYVCAVDAFAPRRNPGCASIKDIVRRQVQLEKTNQRASRTATAASISTMQRDEERRDSWLGRMEAFSAGEPSVRQPH